MDKEIIEKISKTYKRLSKEESIKAEKKKISAIFNPEVRRNKDPFISHMINNHERRGIILKKSY